MKCGECKEQLVALLEGLLDQSQQTRLESHLDDCPECRAELENMRQLFDRLVSRGQAVPNVSLDLQCTDELILKQSSMQRNKKMKRIAKLAVAAVVLIGAFVGIPQFFGDGNGITALAQAAENLKRAKTVTWTSRSDWKWTSKDGNTQWIETKSWQCMWKAPGLKKEIYYDSQGEIDNIRINNFIIGARLFIEPKTKKARLTYPGVPTAGTDKCGSDLLTYMSQWLKKTEDGWIMGEPKPLGKKVIDGRESLGYRVSRMGISYSKEKGRQDEPWSADLWIDPQTQQVIRVHNPGVDVYDREKEPALHNPPGKMKYRQESLGYVINDIVYDKELDDSLFNLVPPAGYELTVVGKPCPTEEEMVEWLGFRAEVNNNVFPNKPGPMHCESEDYKRLMKKWSSEEKLTSAEKKVFDNLGALDRYLPVLRFAALVAGDSWHYAGKGVKLGDKTTPVCWYKPKDSKTYRVVYGDLSIKDVAEEDLPKP